MIARERRKLSLDQSEAQSFDKTALKAFKMSLQDLEFFDSGFKTYYDRKLKAIVLRTEELAIKKRYVSLSAAQTMILRAVHEEISGVKKSVTAADLLGKIILRKCDLETIESILKTLVKKRILEEEKAQLQDRKISVFKWR